MNLRIVTIIFYALILSILIVGCGGGGGSQTATTVSLVAIAISPVSSQVTLGKSQQFSALGTYSDGSTEDLTSLVSWATSDQTILSISNSTPNKGLATTGKLGKTMINASHAGLTSSADVTVTAATLVSITITPPSRALPIGLAGQLVAIGTYSDGTKQEVTTFASWKSSEQMIAAVTDSIVAKGVVSTLRTGTATITATIDDIVATTIFTVLPYRALDADVPDTTGGISSTMGIDAAGNILAVWAYQWPYPGERMYTATYDITKGWLPTAVFNVGSINDTVRSPQLAVNDSGVGLLVWTGLNGIYSSLYVPRLGWQLPVVVKSGPSTSQTYAEVFSVKLDSAGNGLLVWSKGDATGYNIYSSRYLIASGWMNPELLGNTANGYGKFSLDVNRSGSAVLAWEKWDLAATGKWTMYANIFDPVTGWKPATQLHVSNMYHNPGAAISDSGNALLVWGDQSEWNFYANWYMPTGGWQPAQVIGSGDFSQYSISVNPNGDAVVLWSDQMSFKVYSNRFVNNSGWQGAELLRQLRGNAASRPQVRIDAAGNILALWYESEYDAMQTYYFKRYLIGSGWQPQTPIWAGIGQPDRAFLISNASGIAAFSWTELYTIFNGQFFKSYEDFFFTLLNIDGSSRQ